MSKNNNSSGNTDTSKVVDFKKIRSEKMEEKRRKTERIFFKTLLGIYTVTEESGLKAVEIMDVSEEGCAFQVPYDSENIWPKSSKEITVRFYFSQDTYLPVTLHIQNSRPYIENGMKYLRYGCKVDQKVSSYQAYKQFVQFLGLYATHSHKDMGSVTHFYL